MVFSVNLGKLSIDRGVNEVRMIKFIVLKVCLPNSHCRIVCTLVYLHFARKTFFDIFYEFYRSKFIESGHLSQFYKNYMMLSCQRIYLLIKLLRNIEYSVKLQYLCNFIRISLITVGFGSNLWNWVYWFNFCLEYDLLIIYLC